MTIHTFADQNQIQHIWQTKAYVRHFDIRILQFKVLFYSSRESNNTYPPFYCLSDKHIPSLDTVSFNELRSLSCVSQPLCYWIQYPWILRLSQLGLSLKIYHPWGDLEFVSHQVRWTCLHHCWGWGNYIIGGTILWYLSTTLFISFTFKLALVFTESASTLFSEFFYLNRNSKKN